MNIVTGWPRALPIDEKAMPVLPLVASMIRSPGFRSSLIRLLQNVECHPVFDASGHIEAFSFCVEDPFPPAKREFDLEQGCVADETGEAANAVLVLSIIHHIFWDIGSR